MATTTNYGWTTPDDTALVKDGASAIRSLGTSVDTTTKNLNPSTTLGDIEYRSSTANTNTRLGIGSTGQVLTVAAGVPSWASPSSGALILVKTQTIGTTVSSITVSSAFSSTYDSYLIIVSGGVFSTEANMNVQLGSTTSGYFWTGYYMGPTSATVNGDNGNSQASFRYAVGGDTTSAAGMFYLIGPNLAKPTKYVADGWRGSSSKTYTNYRGSETSSTQHTAFTLNVEGGNTATGGTIKVYGYANS